MEWMDVMPMANRTKISNLVKGFGQSILALSFNLGAILAGTLLVLYYDVLSSTSWALLLFPGILSIRGAIGGLFSSHLSTALHLGTVRATYTKNTRVFYHLLYAIITLTLVSSIIIGIATSIFSAILLGTTTADFYAILTVIITTMGISFVLITPITLIISVLAFKKGLNPDVIVYPIISTVADVLVTLCYILVLNGFFTSNLERIMIGVFDLLFLLIVCYVFVKNYREKAFVKTVKEFLFTLVLVAFIVNITGFVLGKISHIIGSKPEIYLIYPALIDTVGAAGSIVGSTATTKLALGMIKSSFSSIKHHLVEIGSAWSASLITFTLYAAIASTMHGLTSLSDFLRLLAQLLTTNILAVLFMVFVSFAVTITTHKRGWDPDNFVIPIESSLADGITTISLLIAIILFA
jgi:mgtE-like transporter